MATHVAAVRGTDQTGGSSTSLAVSSSLTLQVGDVVHVYVSFAQTGASGITATVADGLGNTYTQVFAEPHSSQTDWTIIGFECIVTNAGTATPTATLSTGVTYRTIHALQGRPGSGNTFATDIDTSAESASPSTTAQPGSAISVVGPGYASAAAAYYSYGTMSSSWGTLVSDTGSIDTAAAYKLISTSGSETPALVSTNGSTWVMGAISTKEVASGPSDTVDQSAYRFGEDDGSESAHTWAAAENTGISSALNATKLLRVQLDATLDPPSKAFRLRYQKNGSGGYVDVPVGTTSTVTINNLPVAAGADDAQQSGSTMTVTGTTVGASLDATTEYVGIRFQNVTIPKGATITAAYLRVVPSGTGEDEPQVTIVGFAEDNTAAFSTTANDITARAVTTASASWSSTDLAATGSSYHNTPSLVSIVQEIIDRSGWASGNAMGFRFQGGSTTTRDLTIESYENTGNNPPQLYVEYTVTNPVYIVASANVTAGGEATTARLTAPSGKTTSDFVTGRRWDDENGADSIDITTDDYTELEWVLRVQAPAADGDYFDFRVYDGTTALTAYDVTPRWTVGTPPATNLATLFRRPPTIFRRH